ncbi:GlsB/YeaQ/YmgE family stress response membrane protein [Gulosibacter bifidus]|uniref:GlsB/YeaQ/YmgE family stress response membrane protein n=1 Tax=Gulosibacter bifidus TaxID=272239 RepID=A0ABW5RFR9_9MICO|nr:GlsB/YeaQ/YmgE family stress response membrane protein [Gulosibacter bifidus]
MSLSWISWIIIGLIVGLIAQAITKDSRKHPWWLTIILGIIGGIVGGWIGGMVVGPEKLDSFFDIWVWIFALIGAVIVTALFEMLTSGKGKADSRR